ncbi:hypothetical protein K8I28_06610 [bacterium]|nr:hypothetical protein [bacterium]
MSIVWIFLDGVGLGEHDAAKNPWAKVAESDAFIATLGRDPGIPGAVWKPLDATFGVDGLPQSASGTTALLTGQPAPRMIGRHLTGFPNQELQDIIAEHSVHKRIMEVGKSPTFANAYGKAYFTRPLTRQSVTTHAVRAAGMRFRMLEEYREGKGVFHDLTAELILAQGHSNKLNLPEKVVNRLSPPKKDTIVKKMISGEIPIITPEEAGRRVARMTDEHDFVLFEYVKTDMAGHAQQQEWADRVVDEVMRFLLTLYNALNLTQDTLLIGSDHGNSEDLSTRSHTRNPVPAVAVGKDAQKMFTDANTIADIVPAIINVMKSG